MAPPSGADLQLESRLVSFALLRREMTNGVREGHTNAIFKCFVASDIQQAELCWCLTAETPAPCAACLLAGTVSRMRCQKECETTDLLIS